MIEALHFVFDGPPGPRCGRFVECETPDGRSIEAGEWHERSDGLWELRVSMQATATAERMAILRHMKKDMGWLGEATANHVRQLINDIRRGDHLKKG